MIDSIKEKAVKYVQKKLWLAKVHLGHAEEKSGAEREIVDLKSKIEMFEWLEGIVLAEPVRHSYWEYDPNAVDWGIGGFCCHDCGVINKNCGHDDRFNPTIFAGTAYCPNCSAKMDGGAENG